MKEKELEQFFGNKGNVSTKEGNLLNTKIEIPVVASLKDPVHSPVHYTSHPSGVECISITEHYNFCIGNAIKYLWRNGLKADPFDSREKQIQDLQKAIWYINREINNLKDGAYERS